MIIGLDLDEVLCGLWARIDKFMRDEHDFYLNYMDDLVDYHVERLLCVPNHIGNEVQTRIDNGEFLRTAPTTPYAEHAVNKLRIAGFKIFIITNRNNDKFRKDTEDWLSKHNLYYDELFMTPDKPNIINQYKVDAMVDDRHDILSIVYRKCGPLKYGIYCIDVPWSKRFHNDSIIKVQNVAEAADNIVTLKGKVK